VIKVKIQTSPAGTFSVAFRPAVVKMRHLLTETRFPFGSLAPLVSSGLYLLCSTCYRLKINSPMRRTYPIHSRQLLLLRENHRALLRVRFHRPEAHLLDADPDWRDLRVGLPLGHCLFRRLTANRLTRVADGQGRESWEATRADRVQDRLHEARNPGHWSENCDDRHPHRLAVVDLRLVQGVDGHGHERWEVDTFTA
jgi:hypothetical protein